MQRVTFDRAWPLHDVAATRRLEAASAAGLPPHTLMQRAGLSVARFALAVAPHAQRIWVACGPGNNGGDGLEAALHLKAWGKSPVVTWLGNAQAAPADAAASHARAIGAGVTFSQEPPEDVDLVIDALLGIGASRAPEGRMQQWVARMNGGELPVLAIDVPSGLDAATGAGTVAVLARWTLSLLALKPGLFTAHGRDAAGNVWLDDLGADTSCEPACATLAAPPHPRPRLHATHKGSYGDVAVIGGAPGMAGAALLAASGAVHAGAGRVFAGLLDPGAHAVDTSLPEVMLRDPASLDLRTMAVACGSGGGDAVRAHLHRVISTAGALVLDADGLNAIATDAQLQALLQARGARGARTVLTPHPLEAARLLGSTTAGVQGDRLAAARALAQRFACTVLLKGSGTVIAAPGEVPAINPTGNALLATGGTGDVLAGLAAARLAAGESAFDAARAAAWLHGDAADHWPAGVPLTAGALARALR